MVPNWAYADDVMIRQEDGQIGRGRKRGRGRGWGRGKGRLGGGDRRMEMCWRRGKERAHFDVDSNSQHAMSFCMSTHQEGEELALSQAIFHSIIVSFTKHSLLPYHMSRCEHVENTFQEHAQSQRLSASNK